MSPVGTILCFDPEGKVASKCVKARQSSVTVSVGWSTLFMEFTWGILFCGLYRAVVMRSGQERGIVVATFQIGCYENE
jgi:hypothetical protein